MTKEPHPEGKILIIGGGIANFTNVASTFKGIIRALEEYAHLIIVRSELIKLTDHDRIRTLKFSFDEEVQISKKA